MTAAPARLLGLDGLRGLACLVVLVTHVAVRYNPAVLEQVPLGIFGFPAVLLFLVLSGVLIYLPFAVAILDGGDEPSTRAFAVRRVLRIMPAYVVIFLVCDFVLSAVFLQNAAVVDEPFTDRGTGMLTDPATLLANLTLTQSLIPSMLQTGINPAWTLTVELCFYAVLPATALLGFWARRRWSVVVAALLPALVLAVVGVLGKVLAHSLLSSTTETDPYLLEWGDNWVAVVARSFLSMADSFALGLAAVVLFLAIERGIVPDHWAARVRWWALTVLLVAGVGSLVPMSLGWRLGTTTMSVAMAGLILFVIVPLARGRRSGIAEALEWGPVKYVGVISLSIYLWHYPVLVVLGRLGLMVHDTWLGLLWNLLLVSAVTIALSAVTYRLVEAPAQRLARRRVPRPAVRP